MTCSACGKPLKGRKPVMIYEPHQPAQRLCQNCWHKAMHHKQSDIPDEIPLKRSEMPQAATKRPR